LYKKAGWYRSGIPGINCLSFKVKKKEK